MKLYIYLVLLLSALAATSLAGSKPKPQNLLLNGGNESPILDDVETSLLNPDEWQVYASPQGVLEKVGISATEAKSGTQSMMFTGTGKENAVQGVWRQVPVEEREKYTFIVYVKNDATHPLSGNNYAKMSVEWKNAEGLEVGRATGPQWNRSLSKKTWKRQRMIISAPRNAEIARLVITLCEDSTPDENATFYADDISFTMK